jgi:uncharacterized protein CbrC (UPF0167 family)
VTCTADGCDRRASLEVTGEDFRAVRFTEYVCRWCAEDLRHAAEAFGKPLTVMPLERVA